jgi:hypothetical protein
MQQDGLVLTSRDPVMHLVPWYQLYTRPPAGLSRAAQQLQLLACSFPKKASGVLANVTRPAQVNAQVNRFYEQSGTVRTTGLA